MGLKRYTVSSIKNLRFTVPSSGGGYAPNVAVLSGSVSGGGGSDSCPWKDKMEFGN